MDVFKLRHVDIADIPITRQNIEVYTQRKAPWFVNEDGEQRYFAVCPSCDNTIQIIRLYDDQYVPFGKHYLSRRREGLGIYSVEHYESCPYAAKNRNQQPDKTARRQESPLTQKIKTLLIEQFDRVIYLLEKQLAMRFSQKMARDMLTDYIAARGWQYGGATPQNVPWIFAYFARSQPLFGRYFCSLELQKAIYNHYSNALWENNILKSNGGYLSPRFCFLYHHRKVVDHHLEETITFSVSDDRQRVIYEKQIPVEGNYFSNLSAMSEKKSKRNWQWVKLAKEAFLQANI
ncbi:hypothetical protein [Arsenophonus apicola]|uniref:hypothetical protein n=1 Tax=Arsenophonus apicola TaxID=2879119 RepID=UPI00387A3782